MEEHRENVTYAVGDPYSIFDYVPHTLLPDGSVRLSPDAIEQMWRKTHDWEPLPNWKRQAEGSSSSASDEAKAYWDMIARKGEDLPPDQNSEEGQP